MRKPDSTPFNNHPLSLIYFINSKLAWEKNLIEHFQENTNVESLLQCLINKSELLIASDGFKTRLNSVGGWIIATKDETILVRGSNPNFGQIETMHSYRSEVYASLVSQLFLKTYTEYFQIPINSKITSYCENKAYVERLTKFISDSYLTRSLFKKTEQEAYRIILQLQTPQFQIIHVRGHQDDDKTFDMLEIPAKLNIEDDIVATTPINTHLLSAPFTIYINDRYIPYQFERELRMYHFQDKAKKFLMNKYD